MYRDAARRLWHVLVESFMVRGASRNIHSHSHSDDVAEPLPCLGIFNHFTVHSRDTMRPLADAE